MGDLNRSKSIEKHGVQNDGFRVLRAFETDQLFNPDIASGKCDLARRARPRNLSNKLCDTTVLSPSPKKHLTSSDSPARRLEVPLIHFEWKNRDLDAPQWQDWLAAGGLAPAVYANLNHPTRPAELRKGSAQQVLTETISKERNRNGFYT